MPVRRHLQRKAKAKSPYANPAPTGTPTTSAPTSAPPSVPASAPASAPTSAPTAPTASPTTLVTSGSSPTATIGYADMEAILNKPRATYDEKKEKALAKLKDSLATLGNHGIDADGLFKVLEEKGPKALVKVLEGLKDPEKGRKFSLALTLARICAETYDLISDPSYKPKCADVKLSDDDEEKGDEDDSKPPAAGAGAASAARRDSLFDEEEEDEVDAEMQAFITYGEEMAKKVADRAFRRANEAAKDAAEAYRLAVLYMP